MESGSMMRFALEGLLGVGERGWAAEIYIIREGVVGKGMTAKISIEIKLEVL
jgi:hypothetical protein